jgi:hypothetical protein
MDAQAREFDRFGPWVLEVTASDPPPPVFMPYLADRREPLLAIKVPRRIERRDAHPGMDLYDYMVCLYPDELEVMHREDRGVRRWTCTYREIGYVSMTRTLLRGSLRLGTPAGTFDVPFNTTADRPVLRAVGIIRERYPRHSCDVARPTDVEMPEQALSFGMRHRLRELRRDEPAMQVVAVQGTARLGTQQAPPGWGLFARVTGKRLLESVHCTDGRELIILDREQRYAYRWEVVYGGATTYLPLAGLHGVDREDEAEVTVTTLRTQGGPVAHAFARTNPCVEAYEGFLARATSTSLNAH